MKGLFISTFHNNTLHQYISCDQMMSVMFITKLSVIIEARIYTLHKLNQMKTLE